VDTGWNIRHHSGGRARLLDRAARLLYERGHVFVGESTPPRRIEARVVGTAVIATLEHTGYRHQVVLKPTELNRSIRDAEVLAGVLESLATSNDRIAKSFPAVLGGDSRAGMLVMAFVQGEGLVARLRRALASGGQTGEDSHSQIRHAARILAAVHGVVADGKPYSGAAVRTNASFVRTFEQTAARFDGVFAAAGFNRPLDLLNRLSSAFFERRGNRTLLIDARPKNAIVRTTGALCFIDLDCAPASPAMGVASFLASLDRLGARYPGRDAQELIAAWKRSFLHAYFASDEPWPEEDLIFFYPWTLLQMFEQHRAEHPWLMPYLRWYYGLRLQRYLGQLQGLSVADITRAPADLFRAHEDEPDATPLPAGVVQAL
jgi:hypothetical protein